MVEKKTAKQPAEKRQTTKRTKMVSRRQHEKLLNLAQQTLGEESKRLEELRIQFQITNDELRVAQQALAAKENTIEELQKKLMSAMAKISRLLRLDDARVSYIRELEATRYDAEKAHCS